MTTFDPNRLARANDPATSHMAAEDARGLCAAHEERILKALDWPIGMHDATAEQIAERCGLDPVAVNRRMRGLVDRGAVEVTRELRKTRSGRYARVFRRASR